MMLNFTTTSAWIKHNLTQNKAKANIRETPFYVIIWNFLSGSQAFWSVLAYVCVCVLDISLTERSGPFALYITQTQTKTDAITHTWRQLKRKQWTRFKQNGYKTQTQTQTETQTRTWRRHFKHNLTQNKAKTNIRETPSYVIIWNFLSGSQGFLVRFGLRLRLRSRYSAHWAIGSVCVIQTDHITWDIKTSHKKKKM